MIRNLVAFVRSLRNPVPDHAALCPDFVEPPADYLVPVEIDRTWQSIVTTRVGLVADLRVGTGLADEDLAEWDRELAWNEAD